MKLKFVDITDTNIMFATELQMSIFPDSCGYQSFVNAIELGKPYWLIYNDDTPIGISGLYVNPILDEPDTVWLGWYGVVDKFRGQGFGRKILAQTIDYAKKLGYKTFRLYTSKKYCPEAISLYDKIMDFGEDYTFEEKDMERAVYTKSLTDQPATKWDNRNLYLNLESDKEKNGLIQYLARKKS